jgi:hypothetical protein
MATGNWRISHDSATRFGSEFKRQIAAEFAGG